MNVIYNKNTGEVLALGDVVPSENEKSVQIPKEKITTPISSTVVDDITSPSRTTVDIKKLKSEKITKVKDKSYSLLEQYDWYVIRKQENGTSIPDTVSTYRSDVRSTEDTATQKIKNATTVKEVRSVEPNWPSEPDV